MEEYLDTFLAFENLSFSVSIIVLWSVLAVFIHMFLSCASGHYNRYAKSTQKAELIMYIVGQLHAILASWFCYYGMFYTCDGWEQGNTLLNSDQCLMNPKNIHYKMGLTTAGFFVYDFIVMWYFVKSSGNLAT